MKTVKVHLPNADKPTTFYPIKCPNCETEGMIVSYGKLNWKCKECGKVFRRIYKKKQKSWHQWNKGLTKETDSRVAEYGKKSAETKRKDPRYAEISRKNLSKAWKLENKTTPEEIKELYWNENLTTYEIAEKLGVNQSAISQYMQRHNIPNRGQGDGLKRRKTPQKEINKKIAKALKGNTNWRFSHEFPNREEKKLIRFFKKWDLPFKYVGDGSFKIAGKCPDFVWKKRKVLIEFFGELWHEESDEPKRIKFFESHGWKTLVIWGKEVGWWSLKRKHITYKWERVLYDKIMKWLAGIE